MSKAIHQASVRAKLPARREPHWGPPLEPGRFIGYRKMVDPKKAKIVTSETWVARARTEDAGRQRYNALGAVSDIFGYSEACKAARDWFAALDAGVVRTEKFTVRVACEEYIEDRAREKGDRCAYDASWRFSKYLFDAPISAIEVAKLRAPAIKNWRDSLGMTKSGANRMTTTLKAALNLAVTNRRVPASWAIEWRSVKQHRNVDRRREIYLDLTQRRALLEAATGRVRDLIEAVLVTGARPGELASATRNAFDSRTKTLTLSGKTGTRTIPLSPAAVMLFERLAKSKLPTAPLLTRDDGKAWKRPASPRKAKDGITRRTDTGAEWTPHVRAAAEAAVVKDEKGREAKLPHGTCLYSLRHSWITTAIQGGLTTLEVSKLTGTSLQMIDKHYGHLVNTSAERLAKVQML